MIIKPANHYFEAVCPVLEEHEEIVWFRHPEHPLSCNQLGIIVFDEGISWVYNGMSQYRYYVKGKKSSVVVGSAERICCECYTGISHKGKSFLYRDANPYNMTYENLVPYKFINTLELREVNARWRSFLKATVEYMNSRTPVLEKRGIEPAQYWSFMELPKWLTKVWYRDKQMPKTAIRKAYEQARPPRPGGYEVKPWKLERAAQIHKLRREGLSHRRIANLLGFKSEANVSHWLKKYPDRGDI